MKCPIVLALVLLAIIMPDCEAAADPTILVKMHFAISWREMCQIEKYLTENIANQIVTGKHGETLPTSRLVLYNFKDNCPKGAAKSAVVEIYVAKTGSSDADVELTKKLYKVLHYLYEQKQERYLGSLFVGKITDITVTGKDAPEESTDYTEIERLYIGIGVACAILILIVIILVTISCVRKRNEDKDDRYTTRAAYKNDDQTIRTYPEARDNPVFDKEKAEKGNPTLTDYRLTTAF